MVEIARQLEALGHDSIWAADVVVQSRSAEAPLQANRATAAPPHGQRSGGSAW
jgi:hypothetical protein